MSLKTLAGAGNELSVPHTISSDQSQSKMKTHLMRHDKHQGRSVCSSLSDFPHSHDIPVRSACPISLIHLATHKLESALRNLAPREIFDILMRFIEDIDQRPTVLPLARSAGQS